MEFGLFIQGYVPEFRRAGDPDAEHHAFENELAAVVAADTAGFKYVWATEHHFLDEYSHLSANDVVLGYLAHATERIHIGSGIFNPLPQVNHPAKVAERVAMLDHLSEGRFEFGTGRGAGSHEILGFPPGMKDLSHHQGDLGGRHRRVPQNVAAGRVRGVRGQVLVAPAPQGAPQAVGKPAIRPCGTPPATPRATRWPPARASACSASRSAPSPSSSRCSPTYKKAIVNAEPIGAFVNDNIMVARRRHVAEDGRRARQQLIDCQPELPPEQRLPLPRHLPAPAAACRRGPS